MTTKDRIKEFIPFLNCSVREFERVTDLGYGIIKAPSELSAPSLQKIFHAFPELSQAWLLTGEGLMFDAASERGALYLYIKEKGLTVREFEQRAALDKGSLMGEITQDMREKILAVAPDFSGVVHETYQSTQTEAPLIELPLIPFGALAGFPSLDNAGVSLEECEKYSVPEFQAHGAQFVIRVSGSSMYPKYSNGDLLACRKVPTASFLQWGKVYVLDTCQGALVKRVFKSEEDPQNNILCVSDNREHYPPFEIPRSDIRSLSIVVGVIRCE